MDTKDWNNLLSAQKDYYLFYKYADLVTEWNKWIGATTLWPCRPIPQWFKAAYYNGEDYAIAKERYNHTREGKKAAHNAAQAKYRIKQKLKRLKKKKRLLKEEKATWHYWCPRDDAFYQFPEGMNFNK